MKLFLSMLVISLLVTSCGIYDPVVVNHEPPFREVPLHHITVHPQPHNMHHFR